MNTQSKDCFVKIEQESMTHGDFQKKVTLIIGLPNGYKICINEIPLDTEKYSCSVYIRDPNDQLISFKSGMSIRYSTYPMEVLDILNWASKL